MDTRSPLMRVYRLSSRRRHAALQDISFELASGVSAFLPVPLAVQQPSPVTALFSLLACDRSPRSGRIAMDGPLRYGSKEYRRAVAWLPPRPEIFHGLNAREHVAYCAWLKGVSREQSWARSMTAMTQLGLSQLAGEPMAELPPLTQRLLEVARASCHRARVLVVDTPELLGAERDTFLQRISEHDPELFQGVLFQAISTAEAQRFADDLVLLAADGVPFVGTVSEFRHAVATDPTLLPRTAPPPPEGAQP